MSTNFRAGVTRDFLKADGTLGGSQGGGSRAGEGPDGEDMLPNRRPRVMT